MISSDLAAPVQLPLLLTRLDMTDDTDEGKDSAPVQLPGSPQLHGFSRLSIE